jgi:hypothetical protein
VIGGVAAYAREMSDNDLPSDAADFDRWICQRVLSPAAPLFGEIELLLSEDPATSKARKLNLYHATLAGVAKGNQTWSTICSYVQTSNASLTPIMDTLIAAELVARVHDPIRANRPLYHPMDSLLRFHYAVIRRHQTRLSRLVANRNAIWNELRPTFRSLVLGPCFEAMARDWTTYAASASTLGGAPDHVGSTVLIRPGEEREQEIDIVVAADDGATPSERTVLALGEAKLAERLKPQHVKRLETARAAIGTRARHAKLLLFGSDFDASLRRAARDRDDLELVDLERMYSGS